MLYVLILSKKIFDTSLDIYTKKIGVIAVASAFDDRHVITNGILYSNYICNLAWFSGQDFDENKIGELITHYNNINNNNVENYMTRNFAELIVQRLLLFVKILRGSSQADF